MVTVAVVGAGIAGAACARALVAGGVDVAVLDRGRVPAGRMASPELGGRSVDTGASYLTVRDERFRVVVDDWVARGLAHPWTDTFHVATPDGLGEAKAGPVRYGAASGLRSLVADLLTDLPLALGTQVSAVGPGPTVDGRAYDAVVLAMPDPQAERLLDPALTAERAAVTGRSWEPVLALAAGWDTRAWPQEFDGCFVDAGSAGSSSGDTTAPAPGSRADGDCVLGWIADDGRRRGDGAPVLVAHSTSPFAAAHLTDPSTATSALVHATRSVLSVPDAPAWTFVQRWSFARPAAAREQPYFLGAQRIGLCGDGWGSPKVETAYLSGLQLGQRLAADLFTT